MEKRSDILEKIGRRDGMTVPDGYFADFASKMAASLPDKPAAPETERRRHGLWQRVRPFAYMAAMFAGIWCMMKMFSMMGGAGAPDLSIDNYPGVMTALNDDSFVKDYVYPTVDEYELMEDIYESGASADDFFIDEPADAISESPLQLP